MADSVAVALPSPSFSVDGASAASEALQIVLCSGEISTVLSVNLGLTAETDASAFVCSLADCVGASASLSRL